MPGQLAQRGLVERGDASRDVGDHDVGGVAVRADLERVLALDLEQVGDLGQAGGRARGYPLPADYNGRRPRLTYPSHVTAFTSVTRSANC